MRVTGTWRVVAVLIIALGGCGSGDEATSASSDGEVVDDVSQDGGEPIALLRFWCDPRRLESTSIDLLDSLLPQIAASVHRALLDRRAKQDALTGLADRRVLESRQDPRDGCLTGSGVRR